MGVIVCDTEQYDTSLHVLEGCKVWGPVPQSLAGGSRHEVFLLIAHSQSSLFVCACVRVGCVCVDVVAVLMTQSFKTFCMNFAAFCRRRCQACYSEIEVMT